MVQSEFAADIREDSAFRVRRSFQHIVEKASWLIGRRFNPHNFEIVKLGIGIPNLASAFHGNRIVPISDIHYGQWVFRRSYGRYRPLALFDGD